MMVFLWFKSEVTPRDRKMAQLGISQSLQNTPIVIGGEQFRATLEIDPVKRPWNKASAILFTIMKEHAKLDRDKFAVRWVTLGLRVDVNCAQTGLMVSMVPLASFTKGGTWVINADTLKLIAPGVDCSEVQARFNDA